MNLLLEHPIIDNTPLAKGIACIALHDNKLSCGHNTEPYRPEIPDSPNKIIKSENHDGKGRVIFRGIAIRRRLRGTGK